MISRKKVVTEHLPLFILSVGPSVGFQAHCHKSIHISNNTQSEQNSIQVKDESSKIVQFDAYRMLAIEWNQRFGLSH